MTYFGIGQGWPPHIYSSLHRSSFTSPLIYSSLLPLIPCLHLIIMNIHNIPLSHMCNTQFLQFASPPCWSGISTLSLHNALITAQDEWLGYTVIDSMCQAMGTRADEGCPHLRTDFPHDPLYLYTAAHILALHAPAHCHPPLLNPTENAFSECASSVINGDVGSGVPRRKLCDLRTNIQRPRPISSNACSLFFSPSLSFSLHPLSP